MTAAYLAPESPAVDRAAPSTAIEGDLTRAVPPPASAPAVATKSQADGTLNLVDDPAQRVSEVRHPLGRRRRSASLVD